MKRIILHIDLNTFFVRCEEIKNPSLIGKPVAVGGEGRGGIVSTCSYEARKYGIHSGMPMFQAKMLCKDLIITSVDFKFYNLMSKEFISYVRKLSNKIEQISCDECYCDITEQYYKYGNNDILGFLAKFQNGLYKATQLKCSIGVGSTKFLAKMGSDYKKPMGITIIRNKDIPNIIFPLSVKDYYGIGAKTAPRLIKIGIKTIGDLYYALKEQRDDVIEFFGKFSIDIINCLEGKSSNQIITEDFDPKSIGTTRTLNFDTNDRYYLKSTLEEEFDRIYESLIKKKKIAKTIHIVFKDAVYTDSFKTKSYSKTFKEPTDDKQFLFDEAIKLFDKSYKDQQVRLIGVTLQNLEDKSKSVVQMTFDNYENFEKENETLLIINQLNRQMHKKVFKRASEVKKD